MPWLLIAGGAALVAGSSLAYYLWKVSTLRRKHPARGDLVRVGGVALHVFVKGAGRPVVMLHGNYGDATDFSGRLMDRVASDFRAIAIDRPGYGFSERPPAGLSLAAQAALLREAVQRAVTQPPLLVAHSWSGFLALAYALDHREDLAGVVLLNPLCYVDSAARITDPHGQGIARAADALPPVLHPLGGDRMYRTSMRARFAPEPVPDTEATDPLLGFRRARRRERRARGEDFNASAADAAALALRYGQIALPLVIVVGDGDRVAIPARQGYRLHNQVHDSRLVVIPNAGHMIHITRPESVMDAIHQAWDVAQVRESDTLRPTPPRLEHDFIADR